MKKFYLDSCIIIYLIEDYSPYRSKIIELLSEGVKLYTSDLTRLECRVKPGQNMDLDLLEEYNSFFKNSILIQNITPEVIDKATKIRTKYKYKTPDSIHLAASIISGSDVFLTNDKRLNSFKEIEIKIL